LYHLLIVCQIQKSSIIFLSAQNLKPRTYRGWIINEWTTSTVLQDLEDYDEELEDEDKGTWATISDFYCRSICNINSWSDLGGTF